MPHAPAMPDAAATPPQDDLSRALAERDQLFQRITWWETHRLEALLPLAVLAFAVGYGAGYLARLALGAPAITAYLTGVASLFLSGRWMNRYFDPTRLTVLDGRIASLRRRGSAPSARP